MKQLLLAFFIYTFIIFALLLVAWVIKYIIFQHKAKTLQKGDVWYDKRYMYNPFESSSPFVIVLDIKKGYNNVYYVQVKDSDTEEINVMQLETLFENYDKVIFKTIQKDGNN